MILIVTYDLNGPLNYAPFYQTLMGLGPWWHHITSTWLVSTYRTPEQVFEAIRPYILDTDRILIAELGPRYTGWLPKEAWQWIEDQRRQEAITSAFLKPPTQPSPFGGTVRLSDIGKAAAEIKGPTVTLGGLGRDKDT